MIEAFNRHAVGMRGDKVVIIDPPRAPMTKEEALMFAAWIVLQATDFDERKFQAYIEAVKAT